MKKLALILASLFFLLLVAPVYAQSYDDFLHVSGRTFVYKGQTVYLRGAHVNNAAWMFNFAGNIMTTEADFQKLAQMGGNHFRWGINYEAWANNKTQFFQLLDQQVGYARKHNVWLVLVAHTVPPACMTSGWQLCNLTNESIQNALISMWVDIAAHYANEPVIAGYDLVNEPGLSWSVIYDFHQRARDQMQAVDPNDHLIFITSDSGGLHNRVLNGNNFVYQAHDYIPLAYTHCGDGNYSQPPVMTNRVYPGNVTEWDGASYFFSKESMSRGDGSMTDIQYRLGVTWARNNNVPIYFGEWGAETCFTGLNQYMQDHSDLYRQWGVHHAVHHWVGTRGRWNIFPGGGNFTPWDQGYYNAIVSGWSGSVRPNFGGGPTIVPSVNPTLPPSSPSPTPTAAPVGGLGIVITSPLQLDRTAVLVGQTVTGTVTYKNDSSTAKTITQFIIAGRPPGGTNLNGPYLDFSPPVTDVTLQPGQSRTITASRTILSSDPTGQWYAFSSYNDGSWHDAPASQNKNFTVGTAQVPTNTPQQVTPTPIAGTIPNPPPWFNSIPEKLKNFLELLYATVVIFERESNLCYLLEGVIPSSQLSNCKSLNP